MLSRLNKEPTMKPPAAATARLFEYIEEWEEEFLQLFPHRYDYIWARHPQVGTKPEWQTESRHPLSDRLLLQGSYLYGVRFGTTTNYLMLDLDITSPYHPQQDPFAIDRICNALEPLGLNSHIAITSSYSKGIHLYFPFTEAQKSYELAIAATTLIENAGYQIAPGILETFPNPKPYTSEGQSLYNAHRLPLQAGSYLLDRDYQPTFGDARTFVSQWKFAQHKNHIDSRQLARLLKQYQRKAYKVSGKASKFLNDLNAEIEAGWTGSGQTNHILGRIAMREYIFRHALNGGEPLSGEKLEKAIQEIAQALPGFDEFCQHRHELPQKAEYWARSVEASPYYPYGHHKHQKAPSVINSETLETINWNQQQQQKAEQRITAAIADLLNQSALPSGAKARCIAICSYGISASTLYKHRNLWHPDHLLDTTNNVPERLEKARETLPDNALQPIEDSFPPSLSRETLPGNGLQPIEDNKLGGVLEGDAPQGNPPLNPLLELGGCGGISTGLQPDFDGVVAALEETTANIPETEVTETEKRRSLSICRFATDPRPPQSTEDRDEADINLQMAENAKNEGSILDIYFSSLHNCTCVVLPNRDIQPIDAWARSRFEPKPDPARESAGIELARQAIAKLVTKQVALKREKFRHWWRDWGG
jgi:hypothetical protein